MSIVCDSAIPQEMHACVLTAPGEFAIQQVPVPVPGPGEVLCKVMAVAICGSDPEIFRGDLAGTWPPHYPFIAGHEWAGIVVKTGAGVTTFAPGDRVAGQAHKGCGHCENCMKGRYTLCLNYGLPETGHRHYGFVTDGAYAQYQKYSIRSISKLPAGVSFSEGALVDTAGVALHGVELCGITPGGTVAVIGPGPIGLCTMRLAKALGAARVLMVGRGARLQAALDLGADEIIDITRHDPVAEVWRLSGERGVDEAFECSGAQGTLHQAIRMVKKGGRISLLGVAKDAVREEIPLKYLAHNEIMITGSRANPNVSDKVIQMMASGQLQVADMITHQLPLENMQQALDIFTNRRHGAIKVVVLPNGGGVEA